MNTMVAFSTVCEIRNAISQAPAAAANICVCPHFHGCGCLNVFDNAKQPALVITEKRVDSFGTITTPEGVEITMRRNPLFAETNKIFALCMRSNTNVALISTRESGAAAPVES